MNSTIRVTLSGQSPTVIGRRTVPVPRTHSPVNPYSGVWAGVSSAPLIFSLANAFMNRMSAELPLSIRTRRTTLSAIQISPINPSLCGWSSLSTSSSMKVIELLRLLAVSPVAVPPKMVWTMCFRSEAFARLLGPGLGYNVVDAALLAAPAGVMILSTNSHKWPSRTSNSIWTRSCMQSFVSWPTSLWKLQHLFWFLRAQSVRSGGGSQSSPRPETWFRTCSTVATSGIFPGRTRLFPGYETLSTYTLIRLSMLPGNPPQVCKDRRDVIAPRKAAAKASANCLNELIDPGINLRYHCHAAPVRVRQKALQRAASLAFCMSIYACHDSRGEGGINYSDLLQPIPLAYKQVELPLESPAVQLLLSEWPSYGSSSILYPGHTPRLAADVQVSPGWSGYFSVGYLAILRMRPQALSRSRSSSGCSQRGFPSVWVCAVLERLADAEVAGCSVSLSEQDCQGLGCPGWLTRPWLYSDWVLRERGWGVTLRLVTYKREAPRSDGDTSGMSVTGTPILKSVMVLMSKQEPQSELAAKVGDGIGTAVGYASDVRRRIECCDRAPPQARAGYHVRGTAYPGNRVPREESCLVGSSWVSGIQRAQEDTFLPPSRDRFAPKNRILWSDQITPSTCYKQGVSLSSPSVLVSTQRRHRRRLVDSVEHPCGPVNVVEGEESINRDHVGGDLSRNSANSRLNVRRSADRDYKRA
ncbi:hypothetical protein TIFTF001_030585 [Ficus carica]|uniref:Uncharacterized protein n=1 Tax=Ficus carica TaxID=3494 RepID=A0AA88DU32_FICCA|nr:hypothetical protein TIFTF001_030585 [Ficus carica]